MAYPLGTLAGFLTHHSLPYETRMSDSHKSEAPKADAKVLDKKTAQAVYDYLLSRPYGEAGELAGKVGKSLG